MATEVRRRAATAGDPEVQVKPYVTVGIDGLPETKGSWVAVGRGRMRRDNPREKAWADAVGWAAKVAMRGKLPLVGGVLVVIDFVLPAPVGRKNQRDVDKLARSCLDSLSGIVYVDDEQVRQLVVVKGVTGEVPGALVSVYPSNGLSAHVIITRAFEAARS